MMSEIIVILFNFRVSSVGGFSGVLVCSVVLFGSEFCSLVARVFEELVLGSVVFVSFDVSVFDCVGSLSELGLLEICG